MIRVFGDVHLGNFALGGGQFNPEGLNQRGVAVMETLRRAVYPYWIRTVQLGDMFDSPEPGSGILSHAVRLFHDRKADFLVGNHDSAHAGHPGALGIFSGDNHRVWTEPKLVQREKKQWLMIPFSPGQAIDNIRAAIKARARRKKGFYLTFHAGIRDDKSPDFLMGAKDAVDLPDLLELAGEYELAGVFAGNWHNYRRWEGKSVGLCDIIQLGALCPTGWDNPGTDYGHVVDVHENRGVSHAKVSHPVFMTADYQGKGWLYEFVSGIYTNMYSYKSPEFSHLFLKIKCEPSHRAEVEAEVDALPELLAFSPGTWSIVIQSVSTKKPTVFVPAKVVSLDDAVMRYTSDPAVRHQSLQYIKDIKE